MSHKDENGMEQKQLAPAFYFTYVYMKGRRVGVVKANRYLNERLLSNPIIGQGIVSKQTPMLVRPKPWTSWNEGGYWYTREEVMRTRESYEQRMYLKEACDQNQMELVFKGLDILGETCWTINAKVFDTVLSVWNSGEALADIPPQVSQLQYPPEPATSKWDVEARMKWIKDCKQASRLIQNAHSQRCDINYKMDIARAV
jgi:DNA-directed RNA polymerase, mitochondrial